MRARAQGGHFGRPSVALRVVFQWLFSLRKNRAFKLRYPARRRVAMVGEGSAVRREYPQSLPEARSISDRVPQPCAGPKQQIGENNSLRTNKRSYPTGAGGWARILRWFSYYRSGWVLVGSPT